MTDRAGAQSGLAVVNVTAGPDTALGTGQAGLPALVGGAAPTSVAGQAVWSVPPQAVADLAASAGPPAGLAVAEPALVWTAAPGDDV